MRKLSKDFYSSCRRNLMDEVAIPL